MTRFYGTEGGSVSGQKTTSLETALLEFKKKKKAFEEAL